MKLLRTGAALVVLSTAIACRDARVPLEPRLAASGAAARAVTAGAGEYSIDDIAAAVPGANAPWRLNDSGVVLVNDPAGEQLEWSEATGPVRLTAPDGLALLIDAINNHGDVAGYTLDANGMHGWYRPAGGAFQAITMPGDWFYFQVLNQRGELVGGYHRLDNTSVGFVWSPLTGRSDFQTTAAGEVVSPWGFNDADEAVGGVFRADGHLDAFTWSPSAGFSIDATAPPNAFYLAVNDSGVRVLHVGSASYVVTADGHRLVPVNPFGSAPVVVNDVNQDGYVAGGAFDPARGKAIPVVWTPDLQRAVELPTLGDGPAVVSVLNSYGDAAGWSAAADGSKHAVFWKHAGTVTALQALTASYVTNAGIAHSLVVKLDAVAAAEQRGDATAKQGAVGAFINEVNAQTGKSITPAHARMLTVLVQRL